MPLLPGLQNSPSSRRTLTLGLSLGYNIMGGILLGLGLGYLAGKKWGHTDGFILAGLFLGLAYGGYELWKFVRILGQEPEDRAEPPGEEPGA